MHVFGQWEETGVQFNNANPIFNNVSPLTHVGEPALKEHSSVRFKKNMSIDMSSLSHWHVFLVDSLEQAEMPRNIMLAFLKKIFFNTGILVQSHSLNKFKSNSFWPWVFV